MSHDIAVPMRGKFFTPGVKVLSAIAAAGIADGRESRLGPQFTRCDAARRDGDLPGDETGRSIAG